MHTDLEALEVVCKYYSATHSSDALRQQKNKVRQLQRRLARSEGDRARLNSMVRQLQAYFQRMQAFIDKAQDRAGGAAGTALILSLSQLMRQRTLIRYAPLL